MSDNNEMREQKFGAGKKELRKAVGVSIQVCNLED